MVISVKNITKSYKSKACRTKVAVKKTSVGIYPTSHNHGSIKNRPVSNRGFPKMVVPPFRKHPIVVAFQILKAIFLPSHEFLGGRDMWLYQLRKWSFLFCSDRQSRKKILWTHPKMDQIIYIYIYTHTYLCLDHWKIPMKMARSRGGGVPYLYMEPVCPLFLGFNPSKQGPFQ